MEVLRRILETLFALVLSIVLLPLLLIIAIAIRATLGSPILFRQLRLGQHRSVFCLLKFRTMTHPEPHQVGSQYDSLRTTRLGKFLRSTSLDELPSIWNLLRGDLSFVGPRPLPVRYRSRFTPEELVRFSVKPGITGLAQIGGRNSLDWDERLALDVEYCRKRTLRLDILILLRTIAVVLKREGINHSASLTMHELPEERLSSRSSAKSRHPQF